MGFAPVRVPASLLIDDRLTSTAKLLWMILRLEPGAPAAPGVLYSRSGLARHTVRRGLAQLAATGWLAEASLTGPVPQSPATLTQGAPALNSSTRATLPLELLLDKQVSPQAKLAYGILQLTPSFRRASKEGEITYSALGALLHLSEKPVRTAIRHLQAAGWLKVTQAHKFRPVQFTLRDPVAERWERELADVKRRLASKGSRGENLMREYLSLLVDSSEFEDDATPGFLTNPLTGHELQLDRYYPHTVAFEFNGPQHYGPTEAYPDENASLRLQSRDLMKIGLCHKRGINLVVLHAEDLSLERMRQRVEGLLPLRNLEGQERRIAFLERISSAYRRRAAESELGARAN